MDDNVCEALAQQGLVEDVGVDVAADNPDTGVHFPYRFDHTGHAGHHGSDDGQSQHVGPGGSDGLFQGGRISKGQGVVVDLHVHTGLFESSRQVGECDGGHLGKSPLVVAS